MFNTCEPTTSGQVCDTTTTSNPKSTTNTITTSSSGGGNARARVRARIAQENALTEQDLDALNDAYFQAFHRVAPPNVIALWRRYRQNGMETSLFLMAIDETMLAPYPSPRYMVAVLSRWIHCGILTEIQRVEEQERRESCIWRQRRARDAERYGFNIDDLPY
ncbi:MAG TPA: hypothetical protein IAA75_08950 [Candidatus Pullichristensenella avicola]|nr:hypothetical protein [Candidatus Pullichristensenella avicola]